MAFPLWAALAIANAASSALGASAENTKRKQELEDKAMEAQWRAWGGDPSKVKVRDEQSVLGGALGGGATGLGLGLVMPTSVENAWNDLLGQGENVNSEQLSDIAKASKGRVAGAGRSPSSVPGIIPVAKPRKLGDQLLSILGAE